MFLSCFCSGIKLHFTYRSFIAGWLLSENLVGGSLIGYTKARLLAAQEFTTSSGLRVPRHVLVPRTKVPSVYLKALQYNI